jgi:tetratricopeptide (TPR) repeat protein
MSIRRPIFVWTVLTSSALALGCMRTEGAELRDGMKVVARERDPKRLQRSAQAFAALGDFARAAQYDLAALEQGADERTIVPELVDFYVHDKQYRAAVFECQKYLRKHPQETTLRFLLANLVAALGEPVVARKELERVLREEPANANAHYALAVILRDDGSDLSSADEHFREYLKLSPGGSHADEARGSLLQRMP